MKLTVIGKTDSIINLNKIGVPIRGKEIAVLNIENEEQQREINGIINMGLVEVVVEKLYTPPAMTEPIILTSDSNQTNQKNKRGRPKGSKNGEKNESKESRDQRRIIAAEAKTQEMGSRVIIAGRNGEPVETKMRHSVINDITDSEKAAESIRAMEKIEREERGEIEEGTVPATPKNETLPPSEQMGRKAVVSTEGGEQKVELANSVLPESKKIKDADPFIDKKDKEIESKQPELPKPSQPASTPKPDSDLPFLDVSGDDNGIDDAFIKI